MKENREQFQKQQEIVTYSESFWGAQCVAIKARSGSPHIVGDFRGRCKPTSWSLVLEANIILHVFTTKTVYYVHHFPLNE